MIHEELANINWDEELSDETDVESSWNRFKSILLGACRKHTKVYWSDKPKTLPYLPRNIKKIIRKKNRAWNKYLKCKPDNHHNKYTILQNKLRNMTRKVIRDHDESIANDSKKNPQKVLALCYSQQPFPSTHQQAKEIRWLQYYQPPKKIADCMNASYCYKLHL